MNLVKNRSKYRFLILLLSIFVTQVYGENDSDYKYLWGNPLPQGNIINSIIFADDLTGWAVTGNGNILKTTDGGVNWNITSSADSTYSDLYDIILTESGIFIASGNNGTIIRSNDNGVNWQKQTFLSIGKLFDLALIPGGGISAAGENGSLLVSYDDGLSWNNIGPGGNGYARHHCWVNENEAFIVGKNLFYRTQNGGDSWEEINEISSFGFNEVYFINENTAYVTDDFYYWESNDGGDTWTKNFILDGPSYRYRTLVLDQQHWFTVCYGEGGEFWETTDGGQNWEQHYINSLLGFPCIEITPNNRLLFGSSIGNIFYTDDNGVNINNGTFNLSQIHTAQINNISQRPDGVLFANNLPSIASDKSVLFISYDEGLSWNELLPQLDLETVNDFQFANNQYGVLGSYSDIRYTSDGGMTWNSSSLPTDYRISNFALPSSEAYFVGAYNINGGGDIFKSTDKGISWNVIGGGLPTGNLQVTNITFATESTAYVAGIFSTQNILYKTIDGGLSWNEVNFSGINEPIVDMIWQNENIGLAAVSNSNGGIFRTVDGGQSWTKVSDNRTRNFTIQENNRIAALNSGDSFFQETLDGGLSWTKISPPLSSQFIGNNGEVTAIALTNNGYIVGGIANRILKASNEIQTDIQQNTIIDNSSLKNTKIISITPNPIKHRATINFITDKEGIVDISVFGMNGKKVKTILHKNLPSGTHKHSFTLFNNEIGSSSVYFINIANDRGFDSKKVILIK